jgi:hypothetical protein
MPKAKPPGPKVFVVPELMADEPTAAGGLLEEHLKAERSRGSVSTRERLESYLVDPGVVRKPAEESWPNAREWAEMSGVEKERWATWEAQHWLDASLKKVLAGKFPREVFKLDAKTRARPSTAARDRNLCAEVLRLMERVDYKRPEAVERVAEAFSVSVRVVEQATELWLWDAAGKKERHRFVPLWEQKLRNAGKLK